jgi:hypothetical protein
VSRVATVVQLALLGLLLGGCAGSTARAGEESLVEKSDERTDDDILYASIIDVFGEEGIEVALAQEDRGVVASDWSSVNEQVRHRWVARVIRANVGLALKVHSQYERLDSTGDSEHWVKADDPYTLRRAERDEQRLGRAIQERFKALGGGKG